MVKFYRSAWDIVMPRLGFYYYFRHLLFLVFKRSMNAGLLSGTIFI